MQFIINCTLCPFLSAIICGTDYDPIPICCIAFSTQSIREVDFAEGWTICCPRTRQLEPILLIWSGG